MNRVEVVSAVLAREAAMTAAIKWCNRDDEMTQFYEVQAQLLGMYEEELRTDQEVTVVVELEQ